MKLISILLLSILFIHCETKKNKIYSGQEMAIIIFEVLKHDEAATQLITTDSTQKESKVRPALWQNALQITNAKAEILKQSIDYYNVHPKEFKVIMDSVEKKINKFRSVQNIPIRDNVELKPAAIE
jgi:hypothetical protein